MKIKGFVLIELMIALAIIGIIFPLANFREIIHRYEFQECMISEQVKVLKFQKVFKKLLKDSSIFTEVRKNKLVADNFFVSVSSNKSNVNLNGEIFNFKSFKIGNFKKNDENLVICDIKNSNSTFKYYLIPGKKKEILNSKKEPSSDNAFVAEEINPYNNEVNDGNHSDEEVRNEK